MTIGLISGYNVRLESRQLDGEFRSFAQSAVHFDVSAHLFYRMLDNGKSQAGAAHGSRSCLVDTIEAFEDARQVLGWNADAGVSDQDVDLSILGSDFDLHFTVGAVELYSVVEQVDEDLFQPQFMADDLDIL